MTDPLPPSDWLKLMLEEIEQRRAEAAAAAKEREQRRAEEAAAAKEREQRRAEEAAAAEEKGRCERGGDESGGEA